MSYRGVALAAIRQGLESPLARWYRGYAGLDLEAIRAGLDAPLAEWYRLRTDHGTAFSSASRRLRQRGQGRFWTSHTSRKTPGRLFLAAPAKVAVMLKASALGPAYRAPRTWLEGSRRRVRAHLGLNSVTLQETIRRAAQGVLPDTVQLSEAYIATAAGVTPRTVRNWLRWARWPRQAMFRLIEPLAGRRVQRHVQAPPRLRVQTVENVLWIVEVGANRLSVRGVVEARGVQRRARRQLIPLRLGRKATAADARPAPLHPEVYPPPSAETTVPPPSMETIVHPVPNVSALSTLGVPLRVGNKRAGTARVTAGVGVETFPADFPAVLLKAVAICRGQRVAWRDLRESVDA